MSSGDPVASRSRALQRLDRISGQSARETHPQHENQTPVDHATPSSLNAHGRRAVSQQHKPVTRAARLACTGSSTAHTTHHTRATARTNPLQHTLAWTSLAPNRSSDPSSSRWRELGRQRPRRLRSSARRGGEGGGRRRRLRAVLARELAAQGPADRGLQPQCTSIRAGAASVHGRGPRSRAPRAFACGRYEGHEGNECS